MNFWSTVGSIIKVTWKIINIIREVIVNFVFLLIILLIFGAVSLFNATSTSTTKPIPKSGFLVLDIEGVIVDDTQFDNDVYQLRRQLNGNKTDPNRENSLFELTKKIKQASEDPAIKGILLSLDNFTGTDMTSLRYIGKYLQQFKESGKPIYAKGAQYQQGQYYLASFADEIFLNSQGSVNLYGLSANQLYFKTLLDNLEVNTHVFRVGTYKSAVEPFIRNDMSQEARQNTTLWLTTMWNNYLSDVAENRKAQPDELLPQPNVILDRVRFVNGDMAEYALHYHLVDQVDSNYQIDQMINQKFNSEPKISIYDYPLAPVYMSSSNTSARMKPNKSIAVVFVNGTISSGDNAIGVAGSDAIANRLRDIGKNPQIYAVVIRINSPGGSVYASEQIRSEIKALRDKNIPVVVSMGGVAASGGYWIASESDYIIADPNTITGSIGIFGIIPTFENTLSNIGVHTDGVQTSPLAGISLTKPLSDEYSQLVQLNIDNGYSKFLSIVSKSREMSIGEVDAIGQGRVWLGQDAVKVGLVDELGDFDDAIDVAAELAELQNYNIDWPKTEKNLFYALFSNYSIFLPKSITEVIYNQLPISQQLKQNLSLVEKLNDPQNRYVYCLNCADVQ